MATVITPNGKPKAVKNLGWLLRHWQTVEYLGFNYAPSEMNDGELIAKLKDGTVFITQYASISVCWNFLRRPTFDGLELRVRKNYEGATRVFHIGDNEYRRINCLPYKEQLAMILA